MQILRADGSSGRSAGPSATKGSAVVYLRVAKPHPGHVAAARTV